MASRMWLVLIMAGLGLVSCQSIEPGRLNEYELRYGHIESEQQQDQMLVRYLRRSHGNDYLMASDRYPTVSYDSSQSIGFSAQLTGNGDGEYLLQFAAGARRPESGPQQSAGFGYQIMAIDTSASMGEERKLESIKPVLRKIYEPLTDQSKPVVWFFNSSVKAIETQNNKEFAQILLQQRARGATDYLALLDELKQYEHHGLLRVLIISDGYSPRFAYQRYELDRVLVQLKERQVVVDTIAFGFDCSAEILGRIAAGTGGHFRFSSTRDELLRHVAGNLLQPVVGNLRVKLVLAQGQVYSLAKANDQEAQAPGLYRAQLGAGERVLQQWRIKGYGRALLQGLAVEVGYYDYQSQSKRSLVLKPELVTGLVADNLQINYHYQLVLNALSQAARMQVARGSGIDFAAAWQLMQLADKLGAQARLRQLSPELASDYLLLRYYIDKHLLRNQDVELPQVFIPGSFRQGYYRYDSSSLAAD